MFFLKVVRSWRYQYLVVSQGNRFATCGRMQISTKRKAVEKIFKFARGVKKIGKALITSNHRYPLNQGLEAKFFQ